MNNREAHFYLEELQRMMTQHRGIFSEEFVCANGMAIQALEQEQGQERKKGKWLHGEAYPHHLYCSVCYRTALPNDGLVDLWGLHMNYCPHCGARMEEQE